MKRLYEAAVKEQFGKAIGVNYCMLGWGDAEAAQLAARNSDLASDVKSLKEDLAAIEQRARSELGLIKQGEHFFLLVEPEEQSGE